MHSFLPYTNSRNYIWHFIVKYLFVIYYAITQKFQHIPRIILHMTEER